MERWYAVAFILVAGLAMDGMLWHRIASGVAEPGYHFLDVGQGDAILVTFRSGVRMLVDAGPDRGTLRELENIVPHGSIDILLITHPQRDHYGGAKSIIERYAIGALLLNGRSEEGESDDPAHPWGALLAAARERNIPVVTVSAGDIIRRGDETAVVLNPDTVTAGSGDLNDTSLVLRADIAGITTLLTGDIGEAVEGYLVAHKDVRADVLKVPHHGSKYSSTEHFLNSVRPHIAVVQSGAGNRFGHPAPEILERFLESGTPVFRTDTDGTIQVVRRGDEVHVFTDKTRVGK